MIKIGTREAQAAHTEFRMIQNTTISLVDELVVPVDVDFTAIVKMAV